MPARFEFVCGNKLDEQIIEGNKGKTHPQCIITVGSDKGLFYLTVLRVHQHHQCNRCNNHSEKRYIDPQRTFFIAAQGIYEGKEIKHSAKSKEEVQLIREIVKRQSPNISKQQCHRHEE